MLSEVTRRALYAPLASAAVVAEAYGISVKTVYSLHARGELQGVKLGAIYRFRTAPIRADLGLPDQATAAEAA